MKKILNLLSAVSLTATASASVVACGEPNDNGGGEKPPKDDLHKLNEVFVDNTIEEIKVSYYPNSSSDGWIHSIYRLSIIEILDNNYNNRDSKISKVIGMQYMSNSLQELSTLYSENKKNENFNNLSKLSEGLEDGENIKENFEFKIDIIHADLLEANNNSDESKQIVERMEEGYITVLIKSLIITQK
ncbi:lipoprotein [Spiroplasma sp. BIUS-1]|uniref:lipoprotein n=1 Tax=Spiroplasma sp. BIUS-1 TaxID=216964 RepID=UPI0013992BCE|nr:lipoprotein [Spiroplasma sp. BIUS-1]QHX36837.1 hypothetical protein SBIUS_v1c05840 [Spiroplasma sp. BIUS-1]